MHSSVLEISERCRLPAGRVASNRAGNAFAVGLLTSAVVLAMVACAAGNDRISTPPSAVGSEPMPPTATDERPIESAPSVASAAGAERPVTMTSAGESSAVELADVVYPFPVQYRSFQAQGLPLRMAYMDMSPATGAHATVVLLHGKNFSGAYWEATARALLGAGFRVVMPDQIGFGKSSKPTAYQYSFQALATHTRELLEGLGVESAHVVGHSMGGMLAVRYALMFPKQTRSLVLVNPIGLEDYGQKVPYASIDTWTADERGKSPDDVREYMRQSYFAGEWKPEYEPLLAIQKASMASPAWPEFALVSAKLYDMILTQPVVADFSQVSVATLLIIGQRDRTAIGKAWASPELRETLGNYPQLERKAARAIPKAKLVELPGLGHVPQFEAPNVTHAALLEFLCHTGSCRQPESG